MNIHLWYNLERLKAVKRGENSDAYAEKEVGETGTGCLLMVQK